MRLEKSRDFSSLALKPERFKDNYLKNERAQKGLIVKIFEKDWFHGIYVSALLTFNVKWLQ